MIKSFSKLPIIAVTGLISLSPALAQKPIKVDLIACFDSVTVPPANAVDAYAKADCGTADSPHDCTLDGLFQNFDAELFGYNTQIASASVASTMAGGGDLAKSLQDPAFQEKLKNMSDADKMKMAMDVQAAMMKDQAHPSASYEKRAVTNVLKEIGDVSDLEAKTAMADMNSESDAVQKKAALDAKLDSVDIGEDEEVAKLPKTFMAETENGKQLVVDPKTEKAVRMKHWDKHITMVNAWLSVRGKAWKEKRATYVKHYTKMNADLAAINYGDDANGDGTRRMLSAAQTKMILALQKLSGESRELWELGARWQQRKIDKEHRLDDALRYGN